MLRITMNVTPDGAKRYYSTADYYLEGQELPGVWRGLGAERLGLSGNVDREAWDALCDNLDPATGKTLTQRQKSNRRVGYDFNFHVPKSVSLVYALTEDDRILDAFRASVADTMTVMEAEMKTRIRSGGRDEDRDTGNMVWGEFVHFTARPVEGVPDPHLHAHCFVFNTTYDPLEQRWKAGQFAELKRDAPFFEAMFHSKLSERMAELGYPIGLTDRGWEVAGVAQSALRKFSRRTERIEKAAAERGMTDPVEKSALGAATREKKRDELSLPELKENWRRRLSATELKAIRAIGEAAREKSVEREPTQEVGDEKSVVSKEKEVATAKGDAAKPLNAALTQDAVANPIALEAAGTDSKARESKTANGSEKTDDSASASGNKAAKAAVDQSYLENAVDLALEHCFVRSAVVSERAAQAEALKRSYGKAGLEDVTRELATRPLLKIERGSRTFVTTREVFEEERRMLDFARRGRGTCRPLGSIAYNLKREWLNDDQRRAVRHVLNSADRVILVRGAAGVGKTTMMQEAAEAIQGGGHQVFAFAPSVGASRGVLREEGFGKADTVKRLLDDRKMQEQARGQVLWIDEAGLLGTRAMGQVFDLADRIDARVVLSGDRKQHGSVERGAPLRLLETHAGLVPAEIKQIQRQQGEYRQVVRALSEGRVEDAFKQLDRMQAIREVASEQRYQALAADYVDALSKGSALVVSPTHAEGERITAEIRALLKRDKRLDSDDHERDTLMNANFTEADRKDAMCYRPNDVLVFHQNARGFKKGQTVRVSDLPKLPLDQAARFQVFRPRKLTLARGDVIRITHNGKTADGKHELANGSLFTVKEIDADGNLELKNGWTIARDFGHLAYGYVVTSHASQGKSVDRVLIGQSAASLPAPSSPAVIATPDSRACASARAASAGRSAASPSRLTCTASP
ncbi:MAG: relaxase domain-containing protein, partial [Phycisphaerales bacterium]|nr:relaxase domain-containing protein [Phycisphaerales bacterium]